MTSRRTYISRVTQTFNIKYHATDLLDRVKHFSICRRRLTIYFLFIIFLLFQKNTAFRSTALLEYRIMTPRHFDYYQLSSLSCLKHAFSPT